MQTGIAWVIGASSGIGRHLSLALAREGWRVAVTSRREQALRELAGTMGRISVYPGDVTDAEGLEALAARIETEQGPVTHAFLNAGDYRPMPLDDFDPHLFRKLMEVNYLGVVNALAALMPRMIERARGEILITASVAGYRGLPLAAPYGATKAALINLAESLRPELATRGVRLRLINPGFVRTPLTDKNHFHMPFLITPEQAAEAILHKLNGRRFEIAFPLPMACLMKTLRMLPYALYFALIDRMTGKA